MAEVLGAELWGSGLFDCGPQDYEYMAKKIIETFNLVDDLEDQLDLPKYRDAATNLRFPLLT